MAPFIIIIVLIGIMEICWYNQNTFWLWRHIRGPNPLTGNWFLSPNKIFSQFERLIQSYGPLLSFWIGTKLVVLVGDADYAADVIMAAQVSEKGKWYTSHLEPLMGRGLMTANGDYWSYHKKLIMPLFGPSQQLKYSSSINKHMQTLTAILRKECCKHELDVKLFVEKCVLDCMMDILMNYQSGFQLGNHSNVTTALKQLQHNIGLRWFNPFMQIQYIYQKIRNFKNDVNDVENVLNPFLQMVTDSTMGKALAPSSSSAYDISTTSNSLIDQMMRQPHKDHKITRDDIFEQSKSMVLSAFSTTASALSFALLMLAIHPEHQRKIHDEITVLHRTDDHEWTPEDLAQMKHLDRCVQETMRLFPPTAYIEHTTVRDLRMGNNYIVPEGTPIIISIGHIHRNADQFPNPDHFDPDHFLPERMRDRHPFAYFPFGHGQRACMGQHLANIALRIGVVHVLRQFRLSTKMRMSDVQLRFDVSLQSQAGFPIQCTSRRN